MSEWKEYRLGEIADIKNGKSRPKHTGNIPVYGGNGILDYSNSSNVKGETIIIGRVGAYCGSVYFENKDIWVSDNALYAKQKTGFNSKYIYFLLKNDNLNQYAGGSSHPLLTQGRLNDLKFKLPDLPTQTAIAEILSSLDDKIELNNKINQELENLAQTLFKHWFIDFEFPNESGDPYKSSGGEMVDSELGEIPKGWEVKQLKDFVNCYDNKRVPLSSRERAIRKGSYPYYGAASLMDYVDDYLFDGIYVLMGEDGSVTDANGYPVLQYVFGQFWVNNHAHVLQGTTISTELVMCLLKNTNISHLVTGAVQPKLNQGNMNKISLAIPNDLNILNSLEMNIKSIYESVRNNTQENQELTLLRDTLLPKLISGELEVADIMAEKA